MRYLLLVLVGYLLLVIEGSVLAVAGLERVAPDLGLLLVTAVALSRRGTLVAQGLFALALGTLAEVLGAVPHGVQSGTYVLAVLCARGFASGLHVQSLAAEALAGLIACAGGGIASAALIRAGGAAGLGLLALLPAHGLSGALLAPAVFALCRRVDRALGLERPTLTVR